MANYREHRSTGLGWWLACSLLLLYSESHLGLADGEALLMVAAGLPASLLGAGSPDIDLASSIPHRRFRLALFLLVSLLALRPLVSAVALQALTAALQEVGLGSSFLPSAVVLLALLIGALAVALLAVFLPHHRGITHRWRFGFATALLLSLLVFQALGTFGLELRSSALVTLAVGFYFVLGFASHLFKDGLLVRKRKRR